MTSLKRIDMSDIVILQRGNTRTGSKVATRATLPSQLGRLPRLEALLLQGSNTSGTLPTELALVTTLTRLDLSRTTMTGLSLVR
jgi:hypothetical protein